MTAAGLRASSTRFKVRPTRSSRVVASASANASTPASSTPRSTRRKRASTLLHPRHRQPRHGGLTARATAAASRGDCAEARSLESAIDDADPRVHDTVYLRDPAIARCLAPARRATALSIQQRREHAWSGTSVTKDAAAAARAADCATVTKLEVQVREIDLDFHDTVFTRNIAIARCLASP